MRERLVVILIALVLGGGAGAGAMFFFAKAPMQRDKRVDGRTLSEWSIYLDDDEDITRREAAWRALPEFPPEQVVPPLIDLLGGKFWVHQRAIQELVRLRGAGVPALTAVVRDDPSSGKASNAIEALRLIGAPSSPAADVIAGRIGDPVAGGKAAQYFMQHGVPRAALAEAMLVLERLDGTARIHAVNVLILAKTDERAAAVLARESQRDIGDGADVFAFDALCTIPNPPDVVVDALANNLADPARERDARRALAKAGTKAIPPLARLSDNPNIRARTAAVELLLSLGRTTPGVEDALLGFEKDTNSDVRLLVARGGGGKLGGATTRQAPAVPAPAPLLAVLNNDSTTLPFRPKPTDAVAPVEENYVPPEDRALASIMSGIKEHRENDETILAAMSVSNSIERARLVRMLPLCRDSQAALNVMSDAAHDEDLNVRRAAVTSLRRCVYSPRAVERLMEAMKNDESPKLRREAADALASVAYQTTVSAALLAAENDADATVGAAARRARVQGQPLR